MPIIIKSESEQLVYGEVCVPYRLDTDDEFARPDEIRKACHRFAVNSSMQNVDQEHDNQQRNVVVVENFIAKANDPDGFVEDSWVAAGKVLDKDTWAGVLKGEINGWSQQGKCQKVERLVKITAVTQMIGKTDTAISDSFQPHAHTFIAKFDRNGKVVPSETGGPIEVDIEYHTHPMRRTTASEIAHNHAHRYDVDWLYKSDTDGVTTEEREQVAKELVNIHPEWLSLVGHGAVRRGFKIVKSDTTFHEVSKMDRIVHAISVPHGKNLIDFITVPGLEWLANPKIAVQKVHVLEKSDKHVILDKTSFVEGSLQKQEIGGLELEVGILKADVLNANAVAISMKSIGDTGLQDANDKPPPPPLTPQYWQTIAGGFYSELEKVNNVVRGVLCQTGFDPKEARNAIQASLDAMKAYTDSIFIDSTLAKTEGNDMTKDETIALIKEQVPEMLKAELPGMLKAEFATFKTDLVADLAKANPDKKPEDDKKDEPTKKDEPVIPAEFTAKLEAISTALGDIKKTQDEQIAKTEKVEADLQKFADSNVSDPGSLNIEIVKDDGTALTPEEAATVVPTRRFGLFKQGHTNPKVQELLRRAAG